MTMRRSALKLAMILVLMTATTTTTTMIEGFGLSTVRWPPRQRIYSAPSSSLLESFHDRALLLHFSKQSSSSDDIDVAADANGDNEYSLQLLQDLVLASSLSYLSMDDTNRKNMAASPYYTKMQDRHLQPVAQVVDDASSQSGATIFVFPSSIVVACRGTANLKNFQTNLQFQLVPPVEDAFLGDDSNTSNMLVHSGFQQASIGLWKVLQPELEQVLIRSETQNAKQIIFTGHSLGAATAFLCAVQYQLQQSDDNKCTKSNISTPRAPASVITFGGPRLCNTALAEYWMSKCFSTTTVVANLVHTQDPILQQNQALWNALGFAICGQEVLCESDAAIVYGWEEADNNNNDIMIGESKLDKTTAALALFNFWDHCMYLGTFVGPRLLV